MPARVPTGEPRPPRRSVLAGALAVLAGSTALAGCRLRLEDDAPEVPFVPRRSMPDEQLLIEQYRQARNLAELATATPGLPGRESLAAVHERQAAVLRTVLTSGGVPLSTLEPGLSERIPPPRGPGTPTTTATSPAPGSTPSALAHAQADAVSPQALTRLAQAGPSRSLLTAIATSRASAATVLGAAVTWPSGSRLPPLVARGGLEPARQAVYATEVAAARSPAPGRAAFLALLEVLHRRVAVLHAAAGDPDGAAAPLAYRLPFAVTTAEDAQRLVGTVLGALVDHGLDGLADVPTGSDLVEVIRLHTEATVLRHQWGAPLPPFPGLADP